MGSSIEHYRQIRLAVILLAAFAAPSAAADVSQIDSAEGDRQSVDATPSTLVQDSAFSAEGSSGSIEGPESELVDILPGVGEPPSPEACDDPNMNCIVSTGDGDVSPLLQMLGLAGAPGPGCATIQQIACANNGCLKRGQKIRSCSAVIWWRLWTGKLYSCVYRVFRMPQQCQNTLSAGLPNCVCAVQYLASWPKAESFGGPPCFRYTRDQFGNLVDLADFSEYDKRGLCSDL